MASAQRKASKVTLKALRRRDDGWVLVVDQLVRVSNGHYKPQRTWVKGPEKILRIVGSCRDAGFVDQVRTALDGRHACYRIRDNELEPFDGNAPSARVIGARDFDRLVKKCRAMEHRLEELESTLKRLAQEAVRRRGTTGVSNPSRGRTNTSAEAPSEAGTPAGVSSTDAAAKVSDERTAQNAANVDRNDSNSQPTEDSVEASSSAEAPTPSSKAGAAVPATDDGPSEGQEDTPANAEASDNVEEPNAPAADDVEGFPSPPASEPSLAFASAEDYGTALSALVDTTVTLEASSLEHYSDAPHFVSELIDDEDQVVGALMVDLTAAVFQGGALMMLGEDVLQEAITSGEASEEVLEGMKEILNVQSRCFNDTPGNPHVRIRGFCRADKDESPWLYASMHRASFQDSFGGTTWMLSK